MTDTNQLPPHTITINDHPEPHIMQWSDLELAAIKKYAEGYALQARAQAQGEPFAWVEHHKGGDNLVWDEPGGRKSPLYATKQPAQATQADVTDAEIVAVMRDGNNCNYNDEAEHIQFARAILALRPAAVPMTYEQIMEVEQSSYVDSRKPVYTTDCWGDEKIEYEPTKYFNMFKFARAIEAHHGITAQAKKETP